MVDVNKKGQVNIPGNLNVNNDLKSENLEVGNNLSVEGETVLQNTVIKGDITVMGTIHRSVGNEEEQPHPEIIRDGILYLGDPKSENAWRVNSNDGQLYFEQMMGGEWVIKQSIM
jgi:hypothetical protein